jgi:hypothetical protein
MFTDRIGRFFQDVTLTPQFPQTAEIAAAMWVKGGKPEVDGVIAADPVVLSYLMAATGPVDVPVGGTTLTVTAENAVQVLENETYILAGGNGPGADAIFSSVISQTFARLKSPDTDASGVLSAFLRGAREHRVQVWSANEAEQNRIDGTIVAGTFLSAPRSADSVGIFFDDPDAGKMSWYLDSTVTYVESRCTDAGRIDTLDLTLASTVPTDLSTLGEYIDGVEQQDGTPGNLRMIVRFTGAVDAPAATLARDGVSLGGQTRLISARQMTSGTVELAPGESTTIRIEFTATPNASSGLSLGPAGSLEIWSTPTAHAPGLQVVDVPVCGGMTQ